MNLVCCVRARAPPSTSSSKLKEYFQASPPEESYKSPPPDPSDHPTSSFTSPLTAIVASTMRTRSSRNKTFPLFSTLPYELRSQIWRYALLQRQDAQPSPQTDPWATWSPYDPSAASRTRLSWPPMLGVCQQARAEAVVFYGGVEGEGGRFTGWKGGEDDEKWLRAKKWNGKIAGTRVMVAGWWWDGSVVG